MRRFTNKRKGFSLIELLIVIAIIGIIATIAIPLLLSARNRAIEEKARNTLRTVVTAEAAYYSRMGVYTSLATLGLAANGGPYVDARVASGGDAHVVLNDAGVLPQSYVITATAVGPGTVYTATDSGEITTP